MFKVSSLVAFMDLPNALLKDPYTSSSIESLRNDPGSHSVFQMADQKLFYNNRLVIPADSSLRHKILSESHNSLTEGHSGYLKTLKRVASSFSGPK